ncbi:hypothetical protein FGZ69_14790 [Lacticaseibacillus paracasei]|nr:hypothetical protein [Lacticaseibacillus paracasei]MCT3318180.1 hypothetical protein [Lacticaseibacillus paracasei]MCT3355342.1 hypothetical protein [Lacticaseibacillus paracasei]MCT3366204.1 hypothetical protein [Lacticaseibacillus paracasei]MCT3376265.1 hypothetical protein [Lacticaseibacillus paracasei]
MSVHKCDGRCFGNCTCSPYTQVSGLVNAFKSER